jgi:hypothetical protein
MDRPSAKQGEIIIRCCFGEVAFNKRNFSLSIEEITTNDAWREALQIEGGAFCYLPSELDIPF